MVCLNLQPSELTETIGSRLIRLRVNHGLKQSDVGKIACIKQSSVSDWESGKTKPSSKSLLRLAEYYGVSPDYILFGVNPAPSINQMLYGLEGGSTDGECLSELDFIKFCSDWFSGSDGETNVRVLTFLNSKYNIINESK